MSVPKYGVLVGKVKKIAADPGFDKSPHYNLIINTNEETYNVSINCRSLDKKMPRILYFVDEDFRNDIINELLKFEEGFHEINYEDNINRGIAIDYIRGGLFDINKMRAIDYDVKGESDLKGLIDRYMKIAVNNEKVILYLFGTCFHHDVKGMHNIHMNQGNRGSHYDENQIYHDGCFFIHFLEENKWISYFLAFQNQSWNTDEKGNPKD